MTATRSFPLSPESVAAARRFTVDALRGLPVELLEVVELMVSELATNCIRHSRTPFELRLARRGDRIRAEVSDRAGGTPTMRAASPEDLGGRGLAIVNMLEEAWGVKELPSGGKTVWFETAAASRSRA